MLKTLKEFNKKYNIDAIVWIVVFLAMFIFGIVRYVQWNQAKRQEKLLSDSYAVHVIYKDPNGNVNDIIADKLLQGPDAVRIWHDGEILGIPFTDIVVYRDKPANIDRLTKYKPLEYCTIQMPDDTQIVVCGIVRCDSGGFTNPDNQILFEPINQIKTANREYYVPSQRLFCQINTDNAG